MAWGGYHLGLLFFLLNTEGKHTVDVLLGTTLSRSAKDSPWFLLPAVSWPLYLYLLTTDSSQVPMSSGSHLPGVYISGCLHRGSQLTSPVPTSADPPPPHGPPASAPVVASCPEDPSSLCWLCPVRPAALPRGQPVHSPRCAPLTPSISDLCVAIIELSETQK